MAHSNGVDYKEVLQDLQARRLKLDAAITAIEDIIGGSAPIPTPLARVPLTPSTLTAVVAGPYTGKTIVASTVEFLRSKNTPQPIKAILEDLKRGGLKTTSKNLYRTVYNTLNNNLDKELFRNERGWWGLKEWEEKK